MMANKNQGTHLTAVPSAASIRPPDQGANTRLPRLVSSQQSKFRTLTATDYSTATKAQQTMKLLSPPNENDCRPHKAAHIILVPHASVDQYLFLSPTPPPTPVLASIKIESQPPVASQAGRRAACVLDRRRPRRGPLDTTHYKLQTVDENNNNNNNNNKTGQHFNFEPTIFRYLQEEEEQDVGELAEQEPEHGEEEEEEAGVSLVDLDRFRRIGASLREISDEFASLRQLTNKSPS